MIEFLISCVAFMILGDVFGNLASMIKFGQNLTFVDRFASSSSNLVNCSAATMCNQGGNFDPSSQIRGHEDAANCSACTIRSQELSPRAIRADSIDGVPSTYHIRVVVG